MPCGVFATRCGVFTCVWGVFVVVCGVLWILKFCRGVVGNFGVVGTLGVKTLEYVLGVDATSAFGVLKS